MKARIAVALILVVLIGAFLWKADSMHQHYDERCAENTRQEQELAQKDAELAHRRQEYEQMDPDDPDGLRTEIEKTEELTQSVLRETEKVRQNTAEMEQQIEQMHQQEQTVQGRQDYMSEVYEKLHEGYEKIQEYLSAD